MKPSAKITLLIDTIQNVRKLQRIGEFDGIGDSNINRFIESMGTSAHRILEDLIVSMRSN